MRRGAGGSTGGFVLMEALAALALGAMILATIPIVAGLMLRNWQRITANSDTLETVAAGMAVLRRDLTSMRREFWGGRGNQSYAFVGTPDTLGIVVGGDGVGPGPGRGLVMFAIRQDMGGGSLVRAAAPMRPGATGFDPAALGNPVTLLAGPWRFEFRYATETDGLLTWGTAWMNPNTMPVAIRLDVLDPVSGQRVVPPLTVRPAVEAEPGCIDPAAGRCGR